MFQTEILYRLLRSRIIVYIGSLNLMLKRTASTAVPGIELRSPGRGLAFTDPSCECSWCERSRKQVDAVNSSCFLLKTSGGAVAFKYRLQLLSLFSKTKIKLLIS